MSPAVAWQHCTDEYNSKVEGKNSKMRAYWFLIFCLFMNFLNAQV
jgi:hypothetical protein